MKIHEKRFLSTILIVFGCSIALIATAQTTQQIARKAFGSTVLLLMEDANRQPISLGSGFFVAPDKIATNLHVVEGAKSGFAKLVGKETKYDIQGYTAIDEKRDLIILKVKRTTAPRLIFADSDLVMVGDPIYAVGNPIGLEGTFSQGIISSVRPIGTDKVLQLTAPISPGSSGGPVLNNKGHVIGVSVATFRGGQNLNFAIPANYLKTLIAQVGIPKPLPKTKTANSKQSLVDNFGGKSIEGVTAGKLEKIYHFTSRPSFSLRNHLRKDVTNVYLYMIFYDKLGDPIDVKFIHFRERIPAGLAKRAQCPERVDSEVLSMVSKGGSVVFRILDYEVAK